MNSGEEGADVPVTEKIAVCVIMTVHSRRSMTLRCLGQLFSQARDNSRLHLSVVMVDDGSTDGTAESVESDFPDVRVVRGDGSLFWSRGMALAQDVAMGLQWDYVLWMNDDVDLDDGALGRLIAERRAADIVVGAMRGDRDGSISYSGLQRVGRRPGALSVVKPSAQAQNIDTFQGNLVLVERDVVLALGGPDDRWSHGYGDIDYGFRAEAHGFSRALAPGTFGFCPRNSALNTWQDPRLTRRGRLRHLVSRRGLPIRDQLLFVRRHGGVAWPLWFVMAYAKKVAYILLRRPLAEF